MTRASCRSGRPVVCGGEKSNWPGHATGSKRPRRRTILDSILLSATLSLLLSLIYPNHITFADDFRHRLTEMAERSDTTNIQSSVVNIQCEPGFAGLGLGFAAFPATGLGGEMNDDAKIVIRKAFGSGRWFPGNSTRLKSMVDGYIENAVCDATKGRIVGAIAPHAGYVYSGKVAGYTFRALKESAQAGHRPETVVVLGFSHRAAFRGVALMDGDRLETPLGQLVLDGDSARIMSEGRRRIFFDHRPHQGEHSAENLIPFLQSVLPGVGAVVALTGDHDARTLEELVAALVELEKRKKLLVLASTDMLHDPDYDLVTKTDRDTLAKVELMDHAAVAKLWKPSKQVFCGIAPVLAVMRFAELQGCHKGTVLHYRNSGDDSPESRGSWVVGYSSVVFVKP